MIIGAGGAYQRPQTGAKSSDKNKSYMQIDVSKDLEKKDNWWKSTYPSY